MATININIIWIPFLYISSITSTEYDCTWSHGNASFDLCQWKKTANTQGDLGYWEVYDDRDSYADNYTYKFNICADVVHKKTNHLNNLCTNNTARQSQSPPLPIGYCYDIINGTNECKCLQTSANHTCIKEAIAPIDIDTAAYQMPRRKSWKDCYRLHNGITAPKFSLIDSYDPTVGVSLKYTNGDWCPAFGKNREFVINLYCKDRYENMPDKTEKISEPSDEGVNGCTYILEIDSTIGCPTQCNVINRKLCAGNGVCEFDETNGVPKCFCFEGWYGEMCDLDFETPSHIALQHKDGTYIAFLIAIVCVMTVLGLIIAYLVCRIYRSKHGYDINAYIDEDMEESVGNVNTTVQASKKFKSGSKLAEPLQKSGDDNDETGHPIVV